MAAIRRAFGKSDAGREIDVIGTTSAGWNQTATPTFLPARRPLLVDSGKVPLITLWMALTLMISGGGLWPRLFPNPDAIPNRSGIVTSANPDAQSGFSAGGSVSIVTRSGTNQWHGDAFEFLRNGVFNSRGYFDTAKDELHRNQFGASLGGPIKKDKLFIFLLTIAGHHQSMRPSTAVRPTFLQCKCGRGQFSISVYFRCFHQRRLQ